MESIEQIVSPDAFASLCKALLAAEYKDFQTIDDSGGDGGNDGYSESQKTLFQFYCPEKPEKANDTTYKTKIRTDLDKARKLADAGYYAIENWIFVTPRELREPVQTYLRTRASSGRMKGVAWSGIKLGELLAKYPHLRSQFPGLIQPDIESAIERSKTEVMGKLDAIEDVRKEYRTRLEKNYQRKIDQSKQKIDGGKYETAKKEYEKILEELELETEKIDPHIYFRVYNNLGVCEFNLGNHNKAAELFDKAYAVESDLPMAICKYSLSKLIRGSSEDGLFIIEKLLERYPDDEHAISVKASILYNLGRYNELISFLKEKKRISLVHWYEGFEQMSRKDYEASTISFEKLTKLEPTNVRAFLLAAQNIMTGMQEIVRNNPFPPDKIPEDRRNKFDCAIAYLKESIRLLKNMEQKEDLEMAYVNLSGCYIGIGLYEESIAATQEALGINHNSSVSFLNKGIAQLKLGKCQDAIKDFQLYKDLGGEDNDVGRHIVFCALQNGDLSLAEEIIPGLLENESGLNLDIAGLAVELYFRRLDNEKLNSLLERIEKEFPDNSQALRIRGLHMKKLGLEGAKDLLQQAVKKSQSESEKISAEFDLADLQFDLKNYLEAAEIYKKYLNLKDGGRATLYYAYCLYNLGQYGFLLNWMKDLSQKVQRQTSFEQLEANANLSLNNLDKASVLLKDLFEKNPDNFQYVVHYGLCRFRLGKEKDAKNAFDAVKHRVSETQDLIILAGGYEYIGEWGNAVELTFRAFQNDQNNPKSHLAFIFTFLKRDQIDEKEPDEKYIKAFQKCISEFSTRFPEEKALQNFEVKDNDVSQILNVVDQMVEMVENITNLYKESQAPLAIIPKMTGKRPFDVWAALTRMPEVGIKTSFGSSDEIDSEAVSVKEGLDGSIVVDIYPLFLLADFNQLDLLSELFKKIYVHQSIMDELTEVIDEYRVSVNKGINMLGKVNGQHRMTEITPEQVKKTLDLLEKIRGFISSDPNVEILGFLKEKTDEENIINALDETTRDSVLLAQELQLSLYCDDRILRAIIGREYGIKSFSSQALFAVACRDHFITLDKRHAFLKGMIDLNYQYISIDAAFIFAQLKSVCYRTDDIKNVVSVLAQKETSTQSLVVVLADLFLIILLDQSAPSKTKLMAFKDILRQLGNNHDLVNIKEGVFSNLKQRVRPEKVGILRLLINQFFT